MIKKILSGLVVSVMLFATMCLTVFANDVSNVAEINTTEYATLASAIEAATDGDTVKLTSDIELNSTVQIPENKSITLDLAGKAVTVTKADETTSINAIENKGTLTLIDTVGNGSIAGRFTVENYGIMVMNSGTVIACDDAGAAIRNYSKFTMNGGTLKAIVPGHSDNSTGGACLRNMTNAEALFTGGTLDSVSARTYAIISNYKLEITPAEGKEFKINAPRGIAIDNGTAKINGGTFETFNSNYAAETYPALYVSGGEGVEVYGGSFISPDQSVWNTSDATNIAIYGGSFTNSMSGKSDYHANDNITIYGGTFEVQPEEKFFADGYEVVENADGTFEVKKENNNVAVIGTTEYATLANAIEAATDGNTLKLLSNIELSATVTIPENKSVTLDLAGKAITVTKSGDRSLYALDNKGTFTLTDTVGGGSITARGNYNYGTMIMNGGTIIACDTNGGYGIWNYGNFTMNDGEVKVTHIGSYADQYGPTGLGNMSGANTLITGGVFNGRNARAYILASEGTLTITPAEGKEVKVYAPRGVAIDNGTAVINGGTFEVYNANEFEGEYVAAETYFPLYIGGGQSVTINGGDFLAPEQSVWNAADVDVSIYGGYFNTSMSGKNEYCANDNITIYGGTYAVQPEEKYFAEGLEAVKNADGTFTVGEKKDEVKTIGSKSAVLRYLDEGTNKYRFLIFTGIDNLAYKEVGYIIKTTDGTSVKKSTNSVYTKISVNGTEYKATDFSAEDGSYISNYIFYQGIGFSDLEYIKTYGISYTPYAITNDGTEIYGTERTFETIEKE